VPGSLSAFFLFIVTEVCLGIGVMLHFTTHKRVYMHPKPAHGDLAVTTNAKTLITGKRAGIQSYAMI
jgi:hypothetical protein